MTAATTQTVVRLVMSGVRGVQKAGQKRDKPNCSISAKRHKSFPPNWLPGMDSNHD